ncbi:hypothetical protein B0O99DRAFT_679807 [Bisporella sp. PMI_857]|nr:hypothetical protein B0O99DRAFT_679807 [Bisporella sp. PMI_857]
MQYSFISAAFLALASTVVVAQDLFDAIQTPARDEVLTAGVPFDLVWNPLAVTGPATIQLLQGDSNVTLSTGAVIAKVENSAGKYTWTPVDLGFKTYGWTITLDSTKQIQYSNPFSIKGSGTTTKTTIQISEGPSYSATSTSTSVTSVPSSTVTVVTTSTSSNVTSTYSAPTQTPHSNSTTSTLLTTATRPSNTVTGPSSTQSPPSQSSSAAMANIVSGGMAMVGGLFIALAL